MLLVLFCGSNFIVNGQIDLRCFKDTKIINSQSIETIDKRQLDFRVGHRFGDMFGSSGGWPSFYGLENAADVMIGFDYGLSNRWNIGISRTKGSNGSELKQFINLRTKFKLLAQSESTPFSLGVYMLSSISTMPKFEGQEVKLTSFESPLHRISYHLQFMAARKFGSRLSMQFNAGFTYRNAVVSGDTNDLLSFGGALKYQMSKSFALIFEGIFPIHSSRVDGENFRPITGVGFEWETGGGHIFQFNLTNGRGLVATDFIPYTQDDWAEGQFRLGFIISRLFSI